MPHERAKPSEHPTENRDFEPPARSTGRMHQNVPVWSDPCCCCEAEPYWREAARELGIDPDREEP